MSLDLSNNDQRAAAVAFANRASQWSTQQHNTSLHQLPLDALTLTEVLRLHLLASGSDNNCNAQWRYVCLQVSSYLDRFAHSQNPKLRVANIKTSLT